MSDPLQIVWDALAASGYGPHGQPRDFRSRCPGHDGDNGGALHVWERDDGAAAICCHAHRCELDRILGPLGLTAADLFPDDGSARVWRPRRGRQLEPDLAYEQFSADALAAALRITALERLGLRYRQELILDYCPVCNAGRPRFVIDGRHDPFEHCELGCSAQMIDDELQIRLAELRGPPHEGERRAADFYAERYGEQAR